MLKRNLLGTVSLLLGFMLNMFGQTVAGSAAGNQPGADIQLFGALWEVGSGQNTTILLRNSGTNHQTTVNIVLYTPDGRQAQTAKLNLTGNLASRVSLDTLVPAADGALHSGGLAIQSTGSIQGQVMIADAQNGGVRYVPLLAGNGFDTENALHASWWLPDQASQGTVTLFNSSGQSIVVTPSVVTEATGGNEQARAGVPLAPFASVTLDLARDLLAKNNPAASLGSLVLRYTGPAHALQPSLAIVNPATGFFLQPDFQASHSQAASQQATTWEFPAVSLVGAQSGESLTAFALLTNSTTSPLQPELTAYFGRSTQREDNKVTLPVAALQPGETRLVNLSQVIAQASNSTGVSHFALTVRHTGAPGDLGLSVLAANQSNSAVRMSAGAILPPEVTDASFWDISAHPALLPMIQNASEGQKTEFVQATLYYADAWGVGTYDLASVNIDATHKRILGLRSAVLSGIPDDNGNTVPSNATFGLVAVRPMQSNVTCASNTGSSALCSQGLSSAAGLSSSSLPVTASNLKPVNLVLASRPQQAPAGAVCSPPPPPPSCPSTVSVGPKTAEPLTAANLATWKTGIGAVFQMNVGPDTTDWSGTKITEAVSESNTTCPASFGNQCTGSSTFTVGAGGTARNGQTFTGKKNAFYDQHNSVGSVSVLDQAGIQSCTSTCSQTYSCNGNAIGHFTITRSFTKGTINGTAVTNVGVTKQ